MCQVSGHGLALAGVVLEQDAAYWEVHVDIPEEGGRIDEAMFGVATKKDRKFYSALQEKEEGRARAVLFGGLPGNHLKMVHELTMRGYLFHRPKLHQSTFALLQRLLLHRLELT